MNQSLHINEGPSEDAVSRMQKEIAVLEADIENLKRDLGAFEVKIHARLDKEIARVRELTAVYKNHRKEKKAKRLEQKRRGKNWVEPKPLKLPDKPREQQFANSEEEQKALKKLYKEAVVHVHPDKLMHAGDQERVLRANALTAQLNSIYKSGDLEELILFYQSIMGSNAMPEGSSSGKELIPESALRLEYLHKKKEALNKQLAQLKSSYTYHVLTTYENPLYFIDELYLQFLEKIKQLEKRTKKARGL